ncbi:MAG: hypothetical protein PHY09_11345 [Desulfuromonadaceae bacterium]|nr:hypothetical protein [Desulfuromonadaceae bacterium]MDD5106719.1 hypothetical protein [Desulfuromonadaceae bacterium]
MRQGTTFGIAQGETETVDLIKLDGIDFITKDGVGGVDKVTYASIAT